MKKLITAILIALLMPVCTSAFEGYKTMYLKFTDGSVQAFDLTDELRIKYTPTEFIVMVKTEKYSFSRTDVQSITYHDDPSGLPSVLADDPETKHFVYDDGKLLISSIDEGGVLSMYSLDGKQVLSTEVSTNTLSVPVPDLVHGVYIITLNHKAEKLIVK